MARNKKTVVFFNGVYLPHLGGVERYTHELATRLTDEYNVYIVTSNTESLEPISVEDGIKVFRLPVKNLPKKNRLPFLKKNAEYMELVEKIKNLKIDRVIINTRLYEMSLFGLKIAKEMGIEPWIIDHSGGFVLKPYEKFMMKKVKKYHPKFYSISKTNQEFLRREFDISSAGIFYNAVSAPKDFKKQKNERIKILFAGRLVKEKGILDLLEAFRRIRNHVNAELIVAGDGPLLKKIKGKYQGVKFLGYVDHEKLLKLFRESDIFAFPTQYTEGFGIVLLEAGISKCAAIIYDDGGGAKELVGSDKNAALAKQKDVNDLSKKLEKLIVDEKYRKSLQENLYRRVVENFTYDKTIKKFKQEVEK